MAPTTARGGLPPTLWEGADGPTIERLVGAIPDPGRSAALQALWRQVWTHRAPAPEGAKQFEAIRFEAFWRAGLVGEIVARAKAVDASDPLVALMLARAEIALGERETGCARARPVAAHMKSLVPALAAEALVMSSYCATSAKGRGAAELAAGLLRESKVDAPIPLAVLDALSGSVRGSPQLPRVVRAIDYRFLELGGTVDAAALVERAEPALLAILAELPGDPRGRVLAAEAA
ncbi:MAG TPA: hypothetical protein PK264_01575, partial [Hyphomicrobiaceae bacterium]|nr:hypothetical protein [Hyphomicrobiaceae bacterium]